MFSSDALWQGGGHAGRQSLRQARAEEFATGSPRPVVVRICFEAGLLADGVPGGFAWHSLRLPANPLHRVCSGVAANITVHSCGGSRGIDRVPFLASADAEEPRKRKATHRVGAGQSSCPCIELQGPRRSCRVPRGCDLLILFFNAKSKDRSLVALGSSYIGPFDILIAK